MVAYDRRLVVGSRAFDKFKKYFLKGMGYPKEMKIRLFNSKAKGTIVAYTRIVKSYVRYTILYSHNSIFHFKHIRHFRYMKRKERSNPFPITETSLRRYIGTLDVEEDRGKFPLIKPAVMFVKKLRNEPKTSFNTTDLILEGLLREAGALCRPKVKPSHINELNVRKFLLRCLYGKTFKAPYNTNLAEFRTGLRCLTSLFCLARSADFRELKKGDIEFEHNNVLIHWRKRKNNQRSKMQQSLVPKLPDHPLCLFNAFDYFIKKTGLADDQLVNCKLSKKGNPFRDSRTSGISAVTCYNDIKKICSELRIDRITEKMCKAVGTRYIISSLFLLNLNEPLSGSS